MFDISKIWSLEVLYNKKPPLFSIRTKYRSKEYIEMLEYIIKGIFNLNRERLAELSNWNAGIHKRLLHVRRFNIWVASIALIKADHST